MPSHCHLTGIRLLPSEGPRVDIGSSWDCPRIASRLPSDGHGRLRTIGLPLDYHRIAIGLPSDCHRIAIGLSSDGNGRARAWRQVAVAHGQGWVNAPSLAMREATLAEFTPAAALRFDGEQPASFEPPSLPPFHSQLPSLLPLPLVHSCLCPSRRIHSCPVSSLSLSFTAALVPPLAFTAALSPPSPLPSQLPLSLPCHSKLTSLPYHAHLPSHSQLYCPTLSSHSQASSQASRAPPPQSASASTASCRGAPSTSAPSTATPSALSCGSLTPATSGSFRRVPSMTSQEHSMAF